MRFFACVYRTSCSLSDRSSTVSRAERQRNGQGEEMKLDMIGAVSAIAIYATVIGLLVAFSGWSLRLRLLIVGAAAAWLALIVTFGVTGFFAPGALGPVPATLLPFAVLTASLCLAYFFLPRIRTSLSVIPLPVLVATQVGRIAGVFFLLLYANGRISAPFAPVAGMGDIMTGAMALVLAWRLSVSASVGRVAVRLWNAFGFLDLVAAVTLGTLSATGAPFCVFRQPPGTSVMGTLPWAFVPTVLVPLYILIHLVIESQLRTARIAARAASGPMLSSTI
jgi:hypothetical protein